MHHLLEVCDVCGLIVVLLTQGQFWPLDQKWDLSHPVSNCTSWIISSFVKFIRIQSAIYYYLFLSCRCLSFEP